MGFFLRKRCKAYKVYKNIIKSVIKDTCLLPLSKMVFKKKIKGWNKLKQIDRTQIDVLAMGMILHWNRVSEDILESLFQVLKMGQTDFCL